MNGSVVVGGIGGVGQSVYFHGLREHHDELREAGRLPVLNSISCLGHSEITRELPRGSKDLSDQLKRAAMSIPLNIGEGAGKRTKPDCRKYFDNARGSAMECNALAV